MARSVKFFWVRYLLAEAGGLGVEVADAEEGVHVLEGHALGLGDEEPDEEEHGEGEGGEQDVGAGEVGVSL